MSMNAMQELRAMLCKELDEIAEKGELSAGSLETAHKLTDTIKNIDKIAMLEDDGYSERHRDGMGRYSRHGGGWEARGRYDDDGASYGRRGEHYVRGHYSRADGKERMMRSFGDLMEDASPEQRKIIERAMEELKRA